MRLVKIVAVLAVYLSWVFGNSIAVLSCNAHHSKTQYICYGGCCLSCDCKQQNLEVCECRHDGWDKLHVEAPHSCNHDHSNKIALYDVVKKSNLNIEPIRLDITAQTSDIIHIEKVADRRNTRYYDLQLTLPLPPTITRCGLRAPPVVA